MAAADSRQLYPRPDGPLDDPVDVEPDLDAGTVWAYLDAESGDAVLTLTDDARGVLRLRPGHDEHQAVLLALLAAACSGARAAEDEDTAAWWAAVARQGEAVLDHVRGAARLPRVAPEGEE